MTYRQRRRLKWTASVVACTALVGATLAHGALGQGQEERSVAAEDVQKSSAANQAKRAPARGRLPAFYRQVVTAEQRERIYQIQQAYAARMAPLREQLTKLEAEMLDEMRGVLSDEQLRRVEQLVAERRDAKQAQSKARPAEPEASGASDASADAASP